MMTRGFTNQQIAHELLVSTSTVKKHVRRIISKLGSPTVPRRPYEPAG